MCPKHTFDQKDPGDDLRRLGNDSGCRKVPKDPKENALSLVVAISPEQSFGAPKGVCGGEPSRTAKAIWRLHDRHHVRVYPSSVSIA